jgi:acetylornithine deacetylase
MDRRISILASESVALLKEMIAVPSPSFEEEKVCSHICGWLTEKGVTHERAGNNIIASHITDEALPTLMLCAHIDTVSASPDYSFDPYSPDYQKAAEIISSIRGEVLKPEEIVAGLGSNDDGASAVAMIAVYRYLCEIDDQGERGIQNNPSHFVGPSPCGQGGSTVLNTSLTPNAEPGQTNRDTGLTEIACGKSTCNIILLLTCEEERSGKNGMTGLWGSRLCSRAEAKDGCIAVDFAIVGEPTGMQPATAERGLLVLDCKSIGKAGHAARNEGVNAIYKAIEDINWFQNYQFPKTSEELGAVKMTVTGINAGTLHNVVPAECSFMVDIRINDCYTNRDIYSVVCESVKSEVKARSFRHNSSHISKEHPIVNRCITLGLKPFGSPTTSNQTAMEFPSLKLGPGESSRSHTANEYIEISEIDNAIKTYIKILDGLNIG